MGTESQTQPDNPGTPPNTSLPQTPITSAPSGALYVERVSEVDALVVSRESLAEFHGIVQRLLRGSGIEAPQVRIQVLKSTAGLSQVNLGSLLGDRNSKSESINAVSLSSQHGENGAKIYVGPGDNTVRAEGVSRNREALRSFRADVEKEVKNIRAIHSFIRVFLVDFKNSVWPRMFVWIGLSLVVVVLTSLIVTFFSQLSLSHQAPLPTYRQVEDRPKVNPPVEPKVEPSLPPQPQPNSNFPALWGIAIGTGIVFFVIGSISIASRLFPTIVFDLGEGHDRYELVKKWRWYFLTAVIITGGGGFLIKHLFTWFLEKPSGQVFSS